MWAERKGKIIYGQDRQEDELTSSFFGPIRYSSTFGVIFGAILTAADFGDKAQNADNSDSFVKPVFDKFLKEKEFETEFEILFWERKSANRSDRSFDEIDLLIRFSDSKTIGIEVKFLSGESGDDQLPKYAENWQDEIDFLLIWADQNEAQSVFEMRKKAVKERAGSLHFGWIAWEKVLDKLISLSKNLENTDRRIASDLSDFLTHKGFDRFISFDKLQTQLENFNIKKEETYEFQ